MSHAGSANNSVRKYCSRSRRARIIARIWRGSTCGPVSSRGGAEGDERAIAGLYDRYGFRDAFNPSFKYDVHKLETGSVDPQSGWVATDYIGIDQGPILLQAANHRNDFVWRYTRRVPAIRLGLKRAGFSGGWLGSSTHLHDAAEL